MVVIEQCNGNGLFQSYIPQDIDHILFELCLGLLVLLLKIHQFKQALHCDIFIECKTFISLTVLLKLQKTGNCASAILNTCFLLNKMRFYSEQLKVFCQNLIIITISQKYIKFLYTFVLCFIILNWYFMIFFLLFLFLAELLAIHTTVLKSKSLQIRE